MSGYTYILYSEKDKGYYIGSTSNLEDRLKRHFDGRSLATRDRLPLKLVYFKEYSTYKEAVNHERHIKKQKSKKYIDILISNAPVAQMDRAPAF